MARYTDLESIMARKSLDVEPANCREVMETKFVEYVEGESVTQTFPVLEGFTNPRKIMPGGFICAAFDNCFGLLVILETGKIEIATVDLNVNYHRPIFARDVMTVQVYLKSKGKTIMSLIGDAHDSKGRLVANATTNIILIGKDQFYKKLL